MNTRYLSLSLLLIAGLLGRSSIQAMEAPGGGAAATEAARSEECAICMTEKATPCIGLRCVHHNSFCTQCIDQWLNASKNNCPLCREQGTVPITVKQRSESAMRASIDVQKLFTIIQEDDLPLFMRCITMFPVVPIVRGLLQETPLHLAAQLNALKIVRHLLAMPLRQTLTTAQDESGCTPLYIACQEGNQAIAQLLIDSNRESMYIANAQGLLPIHAAAKNNRIGILSLLLAQDPRLVSVRESRAMTPAHMAAGYGKASALTYLAIHGARMSAQTVLGHSVRTIIGAQHAQSKIAQCADELVEIENGLFFPKTGHHLNPSVLSAVKRLDPADLPNKAALIEALKEAGFTE